MSIELTDARQGQSETCTSTSSVLARNFESYQGAPRADDSLGTTTAPHYDDARTKDEDGNGRRGRRNGSSSPQQEQKLGLMMFAIIVFYNVSGGPFGVEAAVRSAGNFYTLLGFLVFPFIWSVPEAIMTAELGSAFPEAAGGVVWVEEAFGSSFGFLSGYLGWVSGATDNAIYPVLFLDYLMQVLGTSNEEESDDRKGFLSFLFVAGASIVLAYVNWLGLNVVGRMSEVICFLAMSPFIVLCLVGVFRVDPKRWFQLPSSDLDELVEEMDDDIGGGFFPNANVGHILLRPFLNNLFWNLNSFDSASCFSAEVRPDAYARGMALAVVAVALGYLLPLLIGLGASDAGQREWEDGFFAEVASDVVGPWLGAWTVFAAGISNIALFQAELSSDAFQLMGMADRSMLPKLFGKRSRHGTPTNAILLGTAVIVVMGVSDLSALIEMLNFNYAISLLLEYSAFIKLRVSRPSLHRPWRLPLGTWGCILLFTPTIIFTVIVMGLATYATLAFSLAINVVGLFLCLAKQRGFWAAEPSYDLVDAASSTTSSVEIGSFDADVDEGDRVLM